MKSNAKIAQQAIIKEINNNRMPRAATLQCACCENMAELYHHEDYTKPLSVTPVCRICHAVLHKRLRAIIPLDENVITLSKWNDLSAWEQVKLLEKYGEARITYHGKPLYDVRLPRNGEPEDE